MKAVVLYGRPDCHLCDDARRALQDLGIAFTEIDIESDDELFKRYLERIPVVAVDGEEVCDFFVDDIEITRRLGTVPGR